MSPAEQAYWLEIAKEEQMLRIPLVIFFTFLLVLVVSLVKQAILNWCHSRYEPGSEIPYCIGCLLGRLWANAKRLGRKT